MTEEDEFFENIMDIDISKPKSAFVLFYKDKNFTYSPNNKETIGELTKKARDAFNRLSKHEKEKYEKLRQEDEQRYERHIALVKKYLINTATLNDNRTPYTLFKEIFIGDYIIENDATYKEAAEEAKRTWESLSKNEKEEWNDHFEKDKETRKEIRNFKPGVKSAYALYVSDQISNEGLSKTEATEKWKNVSRKIKDKYVEKAKIENEKNEKLRDIFEIANGIKPKRPAGPRAIFAAELSQNSEIKTQNFLQEVQTRYNELSDAEKETYKKKHKILQIKYQIKKKEYKKANPEKIKRARSAYNIYMQDKKESIKNDGEKFLPGEFFRKIHEMWLKEPQKVRDEYNRKSEEEREKIKEESGLADKPIKPMTPYNIFIKNFSIKNYEKYGTNTFKEASLAWKNVPINEKKRMKEDYDNKFKEYLDDMEDYNNYLNENFKSQSKSVSKFRSQLQSKRLSNESKKINLSKSKSKSKNLDMSTQSQNKKSMQVNIKSNSQKDMKDQKDKDASKKKK